MRQRAAVAVALLIVLAASPLPSAQSGAAGPEPQSYATSATAILVDVVVRDRRGRPVTDLAGPDFEIEEDGVAQHVDTFTRISRGGGIGVGVAWKSSVTTVAVSSADPGATADGPEPVERAHGVTALVFDHLSAESLRLAQRATLGHIPMSGESDIRVGVFATDPGVRVLQGYTSDRSRVRHAVQRVVPAGSSAPEQRSERAAELTERRSRLRDGNGGESSAPGAGSDPTAASSRIGLRETELRLVQTELNMIRSFEHLDREHRGYDTSQALLTVIQSLAEFPGRKTIVFFSEGLPVSPVLAARLDHVIEAANRANVTAYAVDAHGLRASSPLQAARREVDEFARERLVQNATGVRRTEQPLTMAFERVEDTLRLDSRTGLARLAQDTGGFLIEGSNDLSGAFRRIDEDHQFHYLLTYSPTNTLFDGKFRSIQVKVRRPGVQVFARKGYRAVRARAIDGSYEPPALALLDRAPLPNAFPVHAAGFSFPDPAQPGLTPVIVRVGTGALHFAVDNERATYSGQAVIVVRLRDAQGRTVQMLSQAYLFVGEAGDVESARRGEILFYREADLEPGVYTMESVVFDPWTNHGSARVATLTIPPSAGSSLRMSSLLLVNRAEEVGESAKGDGPLYAGRTLLYPNLGEPIVKSVTTELPFYFTLYGDARDVTALAELLRNGQALAEAPVPLPPTDGGRVQHVGRLPIAELPTGTYELRIRVTREGEELSRSVFFTLQD